MEVKEMKAQTLKNWIARLEMVNKIDQDEHNKGLYEKWLKEAREEQKARAERREAYLKCKSKGLFG